MIESVTGSDAIPVLERLIQFSGSRHRVITDNIANLDTPGYRPMDVSVEDFREHLGDAIDARRERGGEGPLETADTGQVEFDPTGLTLHPEPIGENILFHDGGDRDLERTMQDLVENFLTFRVAVNLLKSRFALLNTAISGRV